MTTIKLTPELQHLLNEYKRSKQRPDATAWEVFNQSSVDVLLAACKVVECLRSQIKDDIEVLREL
jgi:hypothetical protein